MEPFSDSLRKDAASARKAFALQKTVIAAAAFALLMGNAAPAAETPQELAEAFCAARVQDNEKQVRALLSPALLKVIAEAEERNDAIAKAAPGDKPPLGDGIPYQGFPDRAPVCKAGQSSELAGRMEVTVRYEFPDTPAANWTDRLLLVQSGTDFLIDDILFQIPANHTEEIGLRSVLFNAFDQ
ncbi:hypothetical protein GCM10007937_45670 [Mesorhizobium albiziae]|nr:hypothetical protein GCM10007937_45670 [Mesorhizobium albiziae]